MKTGVGPEAENIWLRPMEKADFDFVYMMQLDVESNRMAVTIPRQRTEFDRHWNDALTNPDVVARMIMTGNTTAGHIACFPGRRGDEVGYWLRPEFWGRGIATAALRQLLADCGKRPLYAHAATSNARSLQVLSKCGFELLSTEYTDATPRYPAGEVAVLRLS